MRDAGTGRRTAADAGRGPRAPRGSAAARAGARGEVLLVSVLQDLLLLQTRNTPSREYGLWSDPETETRAARARTTDTEVRVARRRGRRSARTDGAADSDTRYMISCAISRIGWNTRCP